MIKTILLSGSSAVGKTSCLKHILKGLSENSETPCVCKIDCIKTEDHITIRNLGFECIAGIGGDICPDHFLVSNLPELFEWATKLEKSTLIIETAGLCHRCSPATKKMIAGCVIDATASSKAPSTLGPMLTNADFIILTKIDMVSQAEREIFSWKIKELNPDAEIFPVDSIAGYGIEKLVSWLKNQKAVDTFEGDRLRFTMPSGVCSYCVGETRVGEKFQQGVTAKINFSGGGL